MTRNALQDGVDSKESTQAPSMSSDYKVPVPIPEDAEPAVRELASLAQRYGQSASQVSCHSCPGACLPGDQGMGSESRIGAGF